MYSNRKQEAFLEEGGELGKDGCDAERSKHWWRSTTSSATSRDGHDRNVLQGPTMAEHIPTWPKLSVRLLCSLPILRVDLQQRTASITLHSPARNLPSLVRSFLSFSHASSKVNVLIFMGFYLIFNWLVIWISDWDSLWLAFFFFFSLKIFLGFLFCGIWMWALNMVSNEYLVQEKLNEDDLAFLFFGICVWVQESAKILSIIGVLRKSIRIIEV